MTGVRLVVGIVVMGLLLPLALVFLLHLPTVTDFLILASSIFMTWGVADLLASLLERPRLKDRTPGKAIREDWQRRQGE